jgi:arylformamidase
MIVDLTCPLGPDTPVYPGDPPVTLTTVRTHGADGYEVTHLCMGSHSGTHLDAPRHFFPEGATLDEYPMDRLFGPGVIVDVRPRKAGPVLIDAALLSERLRLAGAAPGDFILLWTGGAFLSPQAAVVLLDTGTTLVGTDGFSLDPPPPIQSGGPSDQSGVARPATVLEPYPAHRLLLGRGVLLAERLCNLDRLGPGPVTCAFLPLAVVGTDGAPVRAIAWR